jgi:isopentenyl diphosphate isomerase/L-lactate dehydrogenase-like FMN-dependent dehydrogenase
VLWGLGTRGEEGVRHVLRILEGELGYAPAMTGFATVDALSPDCLAKVPMEGVVRAEPRWRAARRSSYDPR